MDLSRILGGSPIAVVIRLAVISIIVGVVLTALDIRPQNLVDHVRLMFHRVWSMGFGAVESVLGFLLLGAVVVIPIWIVVRIFAALRRRDG